MPGDSGIEHVEAGGLEVQLLLQRDGQLFHKAKVSMLAYAWFIFFEAESPLARERIEWTSRLTATPFLKAYLSQDTPSKISAPAKKNNGVMTGSSPPHM